MTLAQLKQKASALKIGGRVLPSDVQLETFQEMIFDSIIQLCEPLNLAIPYQDSDIYSPIKEDGAIEWFLKKPRIAKEDADYIDIDSGLELAFVYYLIAFVANDNDKVNFEQKAERVCVEYAVSVLEMGLPRAKEVYEEESYITSVRFDCVGKYYEVNVSFVLEVISCLLFHNVCMNASYKKQIERYKLYLQGASMRPSDLSSLRALDRAIFLYVMNNMEEYSSCSDEMLSSITTLSCELGKLFRGESVEPWVEEIDKRLGIEWKVA